MTGGGVPGDGSVSRGPTSAPDTGAQATRTHSKYIPVSELDAYWALNPGLRVRLDDGTDRIIRALQPRDGPDGDETACPLEVAFDDDTFVVLRRGVGVEVCSPRDIVDPIDGPP